MTSNNSDIDTMNNINKTDNINKSDNVSFSDNKQIDLDFITKIEKMKLKADEGDLESIQSYAQYCLANLEDYDQGIKYLQIGIDKDDGHCMFMMGLYYYHYNIDYQMMKKYFNMGIEKGNDKAMYNLARYYHEEENDIELMLKYLLMSIEKDNSDSMVYLGRYYLFEKDYQNALKYLNMGFEKNNSLAMLFLALYYEEHDNLEKAKELLLKAVETDDENEKALMKLVSVYIEEENFEEAKKFLLLGIERDFKDAIMRLAKLYGELDDNESELKYLQMAYDNNIEKSILVLGCYYMEKNENNELAKKYLLEAVEKNINQSKYFLAIYYLNHEKNTQLFKKYIYDEADNSEDEENKNQAKESIGKYYAYCFNNQEERAKHNIIQRIDDEKKNVYVEFHDIDGYCFHCKKDKCELNEKKLNMEFEEIFKTYKFEFDHEYIDTDIKESFIEIFNSMSIDVDKYNLQNDKILLFIGLYYKFKNNSYMSFKYFKLASDKNNIYGLYEIGNYYYHIQKDIHEAKIYYLKASELGASSAMANLGSIYKDEENYEQMKKFFMMAIFKGNSNAMYNLATYYHYIEKDYMLMEKYYQMAWEIGGDSDALVQLGRYYKDDELNFEKAKELLKLACDKENSKAYLIYGEYLETNELEYDLAFKYYDKALENNEPYAYFKLGKFYMENESNSDKMLKYMKLGIKNGVKDCATYLFNYYRNTNDTEQTYKYYKILSKFEECEDHEYESDNESVSGSDNITDDTNNYTNNNIKLDKEYINSLEYIIN